MQLRPGNAGSADHVNLIDRAIAQIPAAYRRDLLVTIDGPAHPTPSSRTCTD